MAETFIEIIKRRRWLFGESGWRRRGEELRLGLVMLEKLMTHPYGGKIGSQRNSQNKR